MNFYLGGYYLVRTSPLDFGSKSNQVVLTASECINDNLLGYWAYPWAKPARKDSASAEKTLRLSKKNIDEIKLWTGKKDAAGVIGWAGVFFDLKTASEYRNSFLSHLSDLYLLAIYFCEDAIEDLLAEFEPESDTYGEIGVYQMLKKRMRERPDENQNFLGFDLIGIEYGGDFHSFHCHDMANELSERFGLILNQFGLFEETADWQPILEHMNDEETGCEPVPWYVVKVKSVGMALPYYRDHVLITEQ